MSATITWSLEGIFPCSLESLLGEGFITLKDLILLLSHWSDHQSCNNWCAGLQSSLSHSSEDEAFLSCWIVNLICVNHALKICRMVMNLTNCDLRINNPKSFYVWMSCDVTGAVCYGEVCACGLCGLSEIIVNCSCGCSIYPDVVIYSGLYGNCNDSMCDALCSETVIWIGFICLYLHVGT